MSPAWSIVTSYQHSTARKRLPEPGLFQSYKSYQSPRPAQLLDLNLGISSGFLLGHSPVAGLLSDADCLLGERVAAGMSGVK